MIDVICYGIVCLDYIWRVARLPRPGGYAPITDEAVLIGGEAANSALALHRWGASVRLIGPTLGTDERGLLLRGMLQQEFPHDTLVLDAHADSRTAYCTCIATEDGHRTMFGRGFGSLVCPSLSPETAASARFFTIDSMAHTEEGQRAVAVAAEAGVHVVAMDSESVPPVCSKADALLVSGERLAFGGVEDSEAAMLAWAREMRERYDATVIVTRGAEGCVAANRDGTEDAVPAYPVAEVVDSTGCGDMFRAGYLYGLTQGWDRAQTLRYASAAAALNCGAMGGWCGVQDVDATLEFMRQESR